MTFDKLNLQKHMLINFKDDDFIDKIKKEEMSVIQFSASWCAPCKVLKPIMEKLSVDKRCANGSNPQKRTRGFKKSWWCSRNTYA